MATTSANLTNEDGHRFAFSAAFEGIDLVLVSDSAITASTYAGTSYTTFKSGLHLIGSTRQEVQILNSQIDFPRLTITVTPPDGDTTILTTFFRENSSTAITTNLAASAGPTATTITVVDTANFPSSGTGTLYAGLEAMTSDYSAKGATTFSITPTGRGLLALFTADGATRYALNHLIDEDGYGTRFSDQPYFHLNRAVNVYLHHWEGSTESGAWSTRANSELIFSGRLKTARDVGSGEIQFELVSQMERLRTSILRQQFRGTVQEGLYFDAAMADIAIRGEKRTATNPSIVTAYGLAETAIGGTGAYVTHDDLAGAINDVLDDWQNANTIPGTWSLDLITTDDGSQRYALMFEDTSAAATDIYGFELSLSAIAADLLGFLGAPGSLSSWVNSNGRSLVKIPLATVGTTKAKALAQDLPLRVALGINPDAGTEQFTIENRKGSFAVQGSIPAILADPSVEGFVQIGDQILGVEQITGSTYKYRTNVTWRLRGLGASGESNPWGGDPGRTSVVIRGVDGPPVEVKQVWIETGRVGDLMLRLMASTGTSGYNSATYDDHPENLSLAIPWTMLDSTSILGIGEDYYALLLTKPTPFLQLFESALNLHGMHAVWKSGKITVVPFGAEGGLGEGDLTLNETNKASGDPKDPQRVHAEVSADSVVNRVTLKWQRQLDEKYSRTVTLNVLSSQTDFAQTRAVNHEAIGVYDDLDLVPGPSAVTQWVERMANSALRYYSRPLCVFERSYDVSLAASMVPGLRVLVTDNYLVNARTGTRGVTNLPCWVLATEFDWTKGVGKAQLAFNVETTGLVAAWGPSALITSYVAATKVITCSTHEFSGSSDAADASYFPAGSKIRMVELSPANPASPSVFVGTVDSRSGDTVTLTTDPTAGAGLTAGLTYVLEYDDAITAVAAQLSYTFIADDATNSTGRASNDGYSWGPPAAIATTTAPSGTLVYKKLRNTDDDTGEPLSVHKFRHVLDFCNCALTYTTSPTHVCETFEAADYQTQTGTSRKLVYGPIPALLTGYTTSLSVQVYGKTSAGTATFRVVCSTGPVSGSSATSLSYPDGGGRYVELTTTGTSMTYLSAGTVAPVFAPGVVPVAWITVEASATAGDTATFGGIYVKEVQ